MRRTAQFPIKGHRCGKNQQKDGEGGGEGGKQASADVKRASTCNKNTGGLRAIAPEATEENHWRTPRNSLIIKAALRGTKRQRERERERERERG
jgi:hypothetical protein